MLARVKLISYFVALLSLFPINSGQQQDPCLSRSLPGSLVTVSNMAVKSQRVRTTLHSVSFIQCGLRCEQQQWCISINFDSKPHLGLCDLTDFGLEDTGGHILSDVLEKREGFIFTQLRELKSVCRENFCLNGGTCISNCTTSKAQCRCPLDIKGDRCQDISECSSNPCLHGGTCTDQVNGYNCACAAGYTGSNCETNINECSSNPCLHGGTCTDLVNGYDCACAAGYTGPNCETNINECSSNPCQHGGTCRDLVNGYDCTCVAGYTGPNCQININECSSNPCLHGGTCTDHVNGYTCRCSYPYYGIHCQIEADD